MHYLPLVIYDILYGDSRGYHLTACTEMIELSTWQRQYCHRERAEFVVVNNRVGSEGATEFRIQVILDNLSISLGVLYKSLHRSVGQ